MSGEHGHDHDAAAMRAGVHHIEPDGHHGCDDVSWVNTLVPSAHQRRAVRLAWATIAWNVVEAVVAIAAGTAASSIALVGFGLDSTVEVMSAVVIVWQFRGLAEDRERRALKLIALSFFGLAAYVAVQAIIDLLRGSGPESSSVGIGLAIASLIVMPMLARAKRRNGNAMGSATVVADSNQTKLCAYLSAILLVGLILNATVGWWWADPIAALAIAALAANEGREAWRGETCDYCC
jgi:divalent metal cation (Fe/Co/Zn/Cd) transporter